MGDPLEQRTVLTGRGRLERARIVGRSWAKFIAQSALGTLVLSCISCGRIAGIDEYHVGGGPARAPCGKLGVYIDGSCTDVGVQECGEGSFTNDRNGGCDPLLPEGPCAELARPGDLTCRAPGACTGGYIQSTLGDLPGGGRFHVKWGAASGDGTEEFPYGSIMQALKALESRAESNILLFPGTYTENVTIDQKVSIFADCPDNTRIQPSTPSLPAITFTSGSNRSKFVNSEILGGDSGVPAVSVQGAGVDFESIRIRNANGPGLSLDDTPSADGAPGTETRVSLWNCLVVGTRGAGVVTHGADLKLDSSTIRDTQPTGDGTEACGLCVRASGRVPSKEQTANVWDPRASHRPLVIVSGSLLENNAGSGVSVIGADVEITKSVIRVSAGSPAREQRFGINVEERLFGNVPAKLTLQQSLVEGVTSVGIRGRSATIDIESSVVRDIGAGAAGSSGAKRCFGNGIRVRWDRDPPGPAAAGLSVRSSLVERTREAGIFLEGGTASIERTIVRDTAADPCADDFGDGVVAYGYPVFAPAVLTMDASRVEGSARAAVVALREATAKLTSCAFVSSPLEVAFAPDAPEPQLANALCGSDSGWAECRAKAQPIESALLGGSGCNAADDTVCNRGCYLDGGNPSGPFVIEPGIRYWPIEHDEVALSFGDEKGCYEVEGLLPSSDVATVGMKPLPAPPEPLDGYTPSVGRSTTGPADQLPPAGALPAFVRVTLHDLLAPVYKTAPGFGDFDLRASTNVGLFVCAPRPEQVAPNEDICRAPGRAVPGVKIALDPPLGVGPFYASLNGVLLPPDQLDATTTGAAGAVAVFVNVPPGDYRVRLTAKDPGQTLDCNADTGGGWTTAAAQAGETNTFRMQVRPALGAGQWVYCSIR